MAPDDLLDRPASRNTVADLQPLLHPDHNLLLAPIHHDSSEAPDPPGWCLMFKATVSIFLAIATLVSTVAAVGALFFAWRHSGKLPMHAFAPENRRCAELVHLKVPNHGKLFRSLVHAYPSQAA